MMELLTKQGDSTLVPQCMYPITGVCCVDRVYTDVAVFDITDEGVAVREICVDTPSRSG